MQDKLKEAAQNFLDTNNVAMMIKLVRKYPEAARIQLKDGTSLLARALMSVEREWPLIIAYVQGGGTFDGPSPTRGPNCQNWCEIILGQINLSPDAYSTARMAMTLIAESGVSVDSELSPGRALSAAIVRDIFNDINPEEGIFALALKMGAKPGPGESNPTFEAAKKYLAPAPEAESLIAFMKRSGIDVMEKNEFGHTPMHMAIGARNIGFIIGLSRNGADLAAHIQAIRESDFSSKDLADIEAEWMDTQISIENKGGEAHTDEARPTLQRSMISRKSF